ncbi:helix-turn-helix domain-containing protein [Paenibacillus sp. YYML68]|uniref:helix-turn-helix domain-containing protein n=1 Tax=Paenibacillus sp. YYML68 TaxID=2909250 RepID=UPI00248FD445|nr:helix-turn-helix transcriptional regulator [Paenibacillus sp. YYML68]
MKVGDRIKVLRLQRGYTQHSMAEKLHIGRAHYSHIENNRINPSIDNLSRIADILNTTTDYLLDRTGDTSQSSVDIDHPAIQLLSRAACRMTEEQVLQLRRVAEVLYPDAFRE